VLIDGVAHVVLHELGVGHRPDERALCGGGEHGRERVGQVARHPHARDGGRAGLVGRDGGADDDARTLDLDRLEPERSQVVGAGVQLRAHHERGGRDPLVVVGADRDQTVVLDLELGQAAPRHADAACGQACGLVGGQGRVGAHERHVGRPLAPQQRRVHAQRTVAGDDDGAVPDLVAVAVRAVQHVAAPPLRDPGDVGQLVAAARGADHATCEHVRAVVERDVERAHRAGHGHGACGADDASVAEHLVAAVREQCARGDTVTREVAVRVCGGCVARAPVVEHEHAPPGTCEDEGRGQAGRAAPDDDDVPRCSAVVRCRSEPRRGGIPGGGGCGVLVVLVRAGHACAPAWAWPVVR